MSPAHPCSSLTPSHPQHLQRRNQPSLCSTEQAPQGLSIFSRRPFAVPSLCHSGEQPAPFLMCGELGVGASAPSAPQLWRCQGAGPGQGDSTELCAPRSDNTVLKHQSKSTNRKRKKEKERGKKPQNQKTPRTKKVERKEKKKMRNNPKDLLTALSQDRTSLRKRGIFVPSFSGAKFQETKQQNKTKLP